MILEYHRAKKGLLFFDYYFQLGYDIDDGQEWEDWELSFGLQIFKNICFEFSAGTDMCHRWLLSIHLIPRPGVSISFVHNLIFFGFTWRRMSEFSNV